MPSYTLLAVRHRQWLLFMLVVVYPSAWIIVNLMSHDATMFNTEILQTEGPGITDVGFATNGSRRGSIRRHDTGDAFRWTQAVHLAGANKPSKCFLTIGLPTVQRPKASYILKTLDSLVNGSSDVDQTEMRVVIFLGDHGTNYTSKLITFLRSSFDKYLQNGFIRLVTAPVEYYPDFETTPLKRTYGDSLQRVRWRSKQNLDYAFLMHYSQTLCDYYLQIEDDVLASKGYFTKIKAYISKQNSLKEDWTMLEFSKHGYIGKLYHTYDLPKLAHLIRVFFNEQPCDFILSRFLALMLQKKLYRHNPELFTHIGYFSSLLNQTRPLISRKMGANPPATLITDIRIFRTHNLQLVYTQRGIFWGKDIEAGKSVKIIFSVPQNLRLIDIKTGKAQNRTIDYLREGELQFGTAITKNRTDCSSYTFFKKFDKGQLTIAKTAENKTRNIQCLKLVVTEAQKEWLIISQISLK